MTFLSWVIVKEKQRLTGGQTFRLQAGESRCCVHVLSFFVFYIESAPFRESLFCCAFFLEGGQYFLCLYQYCLYCSAGASFLFLVRMRDCCEVKDLMILAERLERNHFLTT